MAHRDEVRWTYALIVPNARIERQRRIECAGARAGMIG